MLRRPPISTRTDSLFPYTTLFRSPARNRHSGQPPGISFNRSTSSPARSISSCVVKYDNNVNLQKRQAAAASGVLRSEEHTSELQSLMRISYAVFCLKKKKSTLQQEHTNTIQLQNQNKTRTHY